jgi:ParB/RepB/Spo0J family partition protein
MQLELIPSIMGNRETVRQNTQRGEEVVKIELSKIVIRDNFNVRQDYGDLKSLAHSILENGQTIPGRVDVLNDGTFVLTDGHRRFKAMQILEQMGEEPLFKAIVNNAKTTDEQRILQMFTSQDNKPLAQHEVAELISRLINLGHTQISVAKKIGKTAGYISQMLQFAHESPLIKEQVKRGRMSVSTALKLKKDIPVQSERVEAVNKAVDSKGKGKSVTAAEVKGNGKTAKEQKDEKFKEVAERIISLFGLEKDKDALPSIVTLLSNYF